MTTTAQQYIGEFGRHSGLGETVEVIVPAGATQTVEAAIRRLWDQLDECDDVREEDNIFARLERMGAIVRD